MSLLPQELSGPQERLRMLELPPLVGGETKKRTVNEADTRRSPDSGDLEQQMRLLEDTNHNVTPLVELDGQVPVRLHPFSIRWIHH